MKKNLALFDLDGTLFDTRMVNYLSYDHALDEFGCAVDYDTFVTNCNGRSYREFLPAILGNDAHLEAVHQKKKQLYSTFLHEAIVNEPLFQLIETIRPTYYTAVVTTASKKNTEEILTHFRKTKLFDLIITQEDVVKKKPDPEGFLKAMAHFSMTAAQTIIFEDSDVGLEAARKSGAAVYAVKEYA